jgi:hypothetical protein
LTTCLTRVRVGMLTCALSSVALAAPTDPPQSARAGDAERDAAPVTYAVDGGQVVAIRGGEPTVLDLPSPALAVHQDGRTLYVARGRAGADVYDVSEPLAPRLLRSIPVGAASADGFTQVEGQVWVVTVSRAAFPADVGVDGATGATPAPSAAATPTPTATAPTTPELSLDEAPGEPPPSPLPESIAFRRLGPGSIELAVGASMGVRVGDRFAVYRSKAVAEGGAQGFTGEELVTVAEVVAVKDGSALAELGRTAIVEDGDYARSAPQDRAGRASVVFPPREAHVGEAAIVLRPLLNAGRPLGGGVLAELELGWWGQSYFTGLRVQPLGLGRTDDGSIVTTAALLEAGYDGRAFAVGAGGGVSWVNGNLDDMLDTFSSYRGSNDAGESAEQSRQTTSAAFTVSQVVRLGARDGLNLQLYNLLLLHRDTETEERGFIYGGTSGRINIPLAGRSDLLVEGGGGLMGYWFAGVGAATWLVGNGAPGSWRLSVSAGAAGISGNREVTESFVDFEGETYRYTYDRSVSIAGPMVSLGVTRRFGL